MTIKQSRKLKEKLLKEQEDKELNERLAREYVHTFIKLLKKI
jgi:hypothetical protein